MSSPTPYDIYMISMSTHPISVMYTRETKPSWKKLGYKVNDFEAVTPKDLYKKNKLDFGVKGDRDFTSTEKAVWYSHFELWCKCVMEDKPFLIIEHDSKLLKPLPDFLNLSYKFLSYINRDFGNKGKAVAPGSGYYITPSIAMRLVATAVSKTIKQNSDGHIGNYLNVLRERKKNDHYYIEQINIDGLNTIDHRKTYRKFIGPDYENFDLSSIHRQEI